MEENAGDPKQVEGEAAGVQIFLQSRCPYGVDLGNRDVGGYPLYGTGPGGFPRTGGETTDRVDATAEVGW